MVSIIRLSNTIEIYILVWVLLKGDSISNNSHLSQTTNGGNNSEEEDEKQRLIERVLELQSTLDDLSKKVTEVKEENLKLKSENTVLGGYIENLMSVSNVFQSAIQNKQQSKKWTTGFFLLSLALYQILCFVFNYLIKMIFLSIYFVFYVLKMISSNVKIKAWLMDFWLLYIIYYIK